MAGGKKKTTARKEEIGVLSSITEDNIGLRRKIGVT